MVEILLGTLVGGLVVGPLLSAMIQHWIDEKRNREYMEADEMERLETARDRECGIGVKKETQQ